MVSAFLTPRLRIAETQTGHDFRPERVQISERNLRFRAKPMTQRDVKASLYFAEPADDFLQLSIGVR